MTLRRDDVVLIVSWTLASLTSFWPEAVHAQVKLEYKFPEGQKLTYRATSRVRQVVTLMNNMQIESIKKEVREWSRSVGKRRADSTVPIEEKVNFLRVDYALPGGIKLKLDSTSPDSKDRDRAARFSRRFIQAGK